MGSKINSRREFKNMAAQLTASGSVTYNLVRIKESEKHRNIVKTFLTGYKTIT
jgi:uncharacterized membrane protein